MVQNDMAPKGILKLGDLAPGFCFSNKVLSYKPEHFQFLVVRANQPSWQGHRTTPVGPGHNGHISVNMAPENKIQKTICHFILPISYFSYFLPNSLIYQDTDVVAFLPG